MQALLATPQPPVDENWYADSSATHHLTADLANLNVRGVSSSRGNCGG
jgi:hypothetical protein